MLPQERNQGSDWLLRLNEGHCCLRLFFELSLSGLYEKSLTAFIIRESPLSA